MINGGIRGWQRTDPRVPLIVTLPDIHGRHSAAPCLLEGIQYPRLIIDQYIMIRRVALFDIRQVLLLVHIDQDASVHCPPQAGSLDFSWLEHHVAVGENHRPITLT